MNKLLHRLLLSNFHTFYFSDLRSSCHRGTSLEKKFAEATLFTDVIFGRARFAIDGILWNLKRFHQRGRDHSIMKRILTKEPLRWFLLLWIATVVVGALLGNNPITIIRNILRQLQNGVVLNHPSILIFLLLAALYSFLLWSGLSEGVQPRFFWLYFLLQGLLVAVIQWILQKFNFTLGFYALDFYLVLTLCAVAMFKRAAPALLVGMSCLLLYFVSLSINIPKEITPRMLLVDWLNIWSFSDLTTIVFFVLGYLILYAQQSQSQRQLEEAHLELQGAHS